MSDDKAIRQRCKAAPAAPETQLVDAASGWSELGYPPGHRPMWSTDNLDAVLYSKTMPGLYTDQCKQGARKDCDAAVLKVWEHLKAAARPAVDVEGLAKVLDYVLEMRSHLCDDPRRTYVARDLAETAAEFIGKNGGRNA